MQKEVNMRKEVLSILLVICLCSGCGNSAKKEQSNTTVKKSEVTTISSNIKWEEITNIKDKDRVIKKNNHILIYDITDYENNNTESKYQYMIFNSDGTKVIETGIQSGDGYVFEKISKDVVRGKRTLGSNVWESVYYNQKTGKKSKKFETPVIEFSKYVGYLIEKNDNIYLKVENMFSDKYVRSFKLDKGEYIPGEFSVSYNSGVITVKNGKKIMKFKK